MVYAGITVEVESLIGTGSNQTMIMIDWESGLTQSYAWLYKYDDTKFVADAFDAIQAAVTDFQWSQSAFVQYINYDDGSEYHQTINTGWLSFWNKDSGDWQWNNFGIYEQQLLNGGWSGTIADDYPDWGDVPPTIPVPEPAAVLLFAIAGCIARRKRR
jgi:hypothetical protein